MRVHPQARGPCLLPATLRVFGQDVLGLDFVPGYVSPLLILPLW